MINCLSYLAEIYYRQFDTQNAIRFWNRSLAIAEKIKFRHGMGQMNANLGSAYSLKGDTAKALAYFKKAFAIQVEIGDLDSRPITLSNIGKILYQQKEYSGAMSYYEEALKGFKEINGKHGITSALHRMAQVYFESGNNTKALEYATKSLDVAKELGYPQYILEPAKLLKDIYSKTDQPKAAFEMYELYLLMRDSISNESTKKASVKSQMKYEYEKKAATDSIRSAEEKKLANVKLREEKTKGWALSGGLCLTLLFAILIFKRFRIIKKQKLVIEEQKELVEQQKNIVEHKQKEILDSIRYAKRIQLSLLPTEKYFSRILKDR